MNKILLFITCLFALWATYSLSENAPRSALGLGAAYHVSNTY
ncbi:MAG: hypothetical protein R3F53_13500 [Gammaproteobacteria bacterium]